MNKNFKIITASIIVLILSFCMLFVSCSRNEEDKSTETNESTDTTKEGAHKHTESSWITDLEPTCLTKGSRHKYCIECNEILAIELINAKGHTYGELLTKEPTCAESGYTYQVCERCQYEKKSSEMLKEKHIESDWITDFDSTCTKDGIKHKECTECKVVLKVEILDAKDHSYGEAQTIDSTCTEKGYTYQVCEKCKYEEKISDIEKKNHTEGEWIIDLEVSCSHPGSRHKECTECKTILKIETMLEDHELNDDGYCSKCGVRLQSMGLKFTLNKDNQSYTVSGIGECEDKDIIIPLKNDGFPVTAIADGAFSSCDITSIKITKNITKIGMIAFAGCESLKSVLIEGNVTMLEIATFTSCSALEKIILPESLTMINTDVFSSCTSLKSIVIPENVERICEDAFYNCTALTDITMPKALKRIEKGVFKECTSLKSIIIPENVQFIAGGAFFNCTSLESAVFENTKNWKIKVDPTIYTPDLTDPKIAAEYLIKTFKICEWERK